MITKVTLEHFKQFGHQEFRLSEHVVLAGPNNSGKSTLLQGIAVWNLARQRWQGERGERASGGSKSSSGRSGVPITRKDFTAIPLRELNLLWTNRSVSLRKDEPPQKPGYPRLMVITLAGNGAEGEWELSFEFRYHSPEMLYVKPRHAAAGLLPQAAQEIGIVHVPPFSGIGSEETHYDRPYQDLLVGQGKPGDILRNLLLELYQKKDQTGWNELAATIEEVFQYRLLPPVYSGTPYILCEYLKGVPPRGRKGGLAQLDIATAGSGFLQVMLLMAFFETRPASVLLLDEPDAHLHVILQKQVYDSLRQIAAKRACQLIIATHSEVLIDGTNPNSIISFYEKPHQLASDIERDQVGEALKRVCAMDVLHAELSPGVLYVEGESDFNLLREWAKVIRHPLAAWFQEKAFWHSNQGRNPREARAHFFALRAIRPAITAFLLLDGDNRNLPDHEVQADGLVIGRWRRYEAESYLIHPNLLRRFLDEKRHAPLFTHAAKAMDWLKEQVPPAFLKDPLADHDFLTSLPVSKRLLPQFLDVANIQLPKEEYYIIASIMKRDEIPPEVVETLNAMQEAFGLEEQPK